MKAYKNCLTTGMKSYLKCPTVGWPPTFQTYPFVGEFWSAKHEFADVCGNPDYLTPLTAFSAFSIIWGITFTHHMIFLFSLLMAVHPAYLDVQEK